jgi:hypothetical protein
MLSAGNILQSQKHKQIKMEGYKEMHYASSQEQERWSSYTDIT